MKEIRATIEVGSEHTNMRGHLITVPLFETAKLLFSSSASFSFWMSLTDVFLLNSKSDQFTSRTYIGIDMY